MIQKLLKMLHLTHEQSDNPIGDQLAKEMRVDLSSIRSEESLMLHRMQYEKSAESDRWILTCDECGLWVFENEQELFAHVIIHSKEALNVSA